MLPPLRRKQLVKFIDHSILPCAWYACGGVECERFLALELVIFLCKVLSGILSKFHFKFIWSFCSNLGVKFCSTRNHKINKWAFRSISWLHLYIMVSGIHKSMHATILFQSFRQNVALTKMLTGLPVPASSKFCTRSRAWIGNMKENELRNKWKRFQFLYTLSCHVCV
jgi:hypothetical protein